MEKKLTDLIQEYLAVMELKGQAPKTLREKRNSLERFERQCNRLDSTLTLQYITWLKTKPVRPYTNNSIIFEINILKPFEKWLLSTYPEQKPFTNLLTLPKKNQPIKDFVYVDPLKIDEAIIAGTTPTHFIRRGFPGDNALNAFRKLETRQALMLVSRKGLRIEEVIRLTGKDLNFDAPFPEFRIAPIKGHGAVWMQIPADMVEELRSRKGKKRVFETTEKLCNLSIQRGWKALELPGDAWNHMLRHQHAAHMLKSGMRMEQLQKEMRHKSIKVTIDTYGHLLNSDVDPLVQALDPRTRQALDFNRQATVVRETLERLHLGGQIKVSYEIRDNELVLSQEMVSTPRT